MGVMQNLFNKFQLLCVIYLLFSCNLGTKSSGGCKAPTEGNQIASAQYSLNTIDIDGSNNSKVLLIRYPEPSHPQYTPDGKNFIYVRKGIWIVDINKDNRERLSITGTSPNLSPDGSKIVYSIYSNGQIWVMNIDGTDNIPLTDGGSYEPQFSPDGLLIAYRNSNNNICIMDYEGNNKKDLISDKYSSVRSFDISPDGRKIVFSATLSQTDIYIINTDGDSLTNLTNDSYDDEQPQFSPNGKEIALVARGEIFVTSRDFLSWFFSIRTARLSGILPSSKWP